MGPTLICDKSSLQQLGRKELNLLRRYYSINIPPVLCMEILGDLKKFDGERGQREVRLLADKLVPLGSTFNTSFRSLIVAEFDGQKIPMDGRPLITGGTHVTSDGEKAGIISEVSPTEEALLRWQVGDFQAAERLLAAEWRRSTLSVDLAGLQHKLRERLKPHLSLSSLDAVAPFVDGLMASPNPPTLCGWFLGILGFGPDDLREILARLMTPGSAHYTVAFPYTAFCLRAALIFGFALVFGHVTNLPNTLVDLEHLFYVPFCNVFSSGDRFHRNMVKYLMKENQLFIWSDDLKIDLRTLADRIEGMGEQDRLAAML